LLHDCEIGFAIGFAEMFENRAIVPVLLEGRKYGLALSGSLDELHIEAVVAQAAIAFGSHIDFRCRIPHDNAANPSCHPARRSHCSPQVSLKGR
jgi:hypothetical protein